MEGLVREERKYYTNIELINVKEVLERRRRELISYYNNVRVSVLERLNHE